MKINIINQIRNSLHIELHVIGDSNIRFQLENHEREREKKNR